jgi:prophage regulatory protein
VRIIRKAELLAKVGYSAMHIYRLEKAGGFPKRVQLGPNSVGWVEAEIEAWIEQRMADRGAT